MNMTDILKVEHLCKSFGGIMATQDVSYSMKSGEFSAIVGPNGAGKTTFFHLISGYHRADSGSVWYKEKNITKWPPHKIARLGVTRCFQVSNNYPMLTTYENVRQAVLTQKKRTLNLFTPAKNLAVEETLNILDMVGISDNANTMAGNLSQGDKKILEIAMALGSKPELLYLDEPTAGMSSDETYKTMELIKRLNEQMGVTILFTEHDMPVVFGYAHRLTVLHQGAIIADGIPEEVRSDKMVQKVYLGEEE